MRSTRGLVELVEILDLLPHALDKVKARRLLARESYQQVCKEYTPVPLEHLTKKCSAYAAFSRADVRFHKLQRLRRRILGEIAVLVIGHAALATISLSFVLSGVVVAYLRSEGILEGSAPIVAIPQLVGNSMLLFAALGLRACNETFEDTRWVEALQAQVEDLARELTEVRGMSTIPFWLLMLSSTPALARILAHVVVDWLRG